MNYESVVAFVTLHLVTIVTFFLAFATIAHMLSQRKTPAAMIAWTVVILTIPYLGILVYVLFNGRKITKIVSRKKKVSLSKIDEISAEKGAPIEQFLRAQDIAGATAANHFYLCHDSIDTYKTILEAIDKAERYIYISTYIFGNDRITRRLVAELARKADEGVHVKLLLDAVGSFSLLLSSKTLHPLQQAGGEVAFFMSPFVRPQENKFNLRNHRKMVLVDGHTVISGGINFSKKYLSERKNRFVWVDLAFKIVGTATTHYEEIFRYDWESQTKQPLPQIAPLAHIFTEQTSIIQVVPSGPDVPNDALYESILYALFLAKKRIWIVTPYFVPDGALMDALIIAKHRGVEIKIVLPHTSDHYLVDVARSGFLRELQKESIDILFYKPVMMHAKAMLIDDQVALVGSSNFDARSFFYNFEVMSYLYSKEDILVVEAWIMRLFEDSRLGLLPARKSRILFENFFKMLSPAL